jgi:catechol 2,3-dioxygenase-like lactoylglutathione lyase family enzyme
MTTDLDQPFFDHAVRFNPPPNRLGLIGVDHIGMAARDPLASGKFIEQILGGVEIMRAGYSEEDIELGRPKHVFYHVGVSVVHVGMQKTEDGYTPADTENNNPHFSFGTTREGILAFADHLRAEGIPFDGPRHHRGESAVSLYFRDPDGNNLEVTTWEEVSREHTTLLGGPAGPVIWAKLAHAWTSRD